MISPGQPIICGLEGVAGPERDIGVLGAVGDVGGTDLKEA